MTGGALPRGHVPVFVFHSLEPESFGRKLAYLADNGYVTLSADEYFEVLAQRRNAPEKAVLLTFDDGRASLWTVGYPLMESHGMKGVVFLVPSRLETSPLRPLRSATTPPPAPSEGFVSWEEVRALAETGLFDFQSHTLRHGRIHTSPRLAGFFTPEHRRGYRSLDAPWIHDGGRDLAPEEVPLGTPFFRSEPRMSEAQRFYEDPEARAPCVRAVAGAGGESFFLQAGWEHRLRRLLEDRRIDGRMETPAERERAMRNELTQSKALIESQTGKPVADLCYPWHASGPTAARLAREAGYRSAFCGKLAGVPITLPGGDPLGIARIGEDYVETLPGRGRVDIVSILRLKWHRRLG